MADGNPDYGDWVSTGIRTRLVELFAATEAAGEAGDKAKVKSLNEEIQATVRHAAAVADRAAAAEKKGDTATATRLYKEVADTIGESLGARACLRVGQAYLRGDGVDADHVAAHRYLEGALAGGEIAALGLLGELYMADSAMTDHAMGIDHLRRAAEAGDGGAHFHLADALWLGKGIPKDRQAAVRHAIIAAASGDALGQAGGHLLLATAYELGDGVPRDTGKARHWYKAAAKLGLDVGKDLDRLNPRHADKGDRFPLLSLALMILWAAGLAWFWSDLSAARVGAGLTVLGTLTIPLLYFAARRSGAKTREQRAAEFRQALIDRPSSIRIGGARWVIVGGEFHRLAHDSGGRGQLYKEETSRTERHTRELGSEMKRSGGIKWVSRIAIVCGLAQLVTPLVIPSGLLAGFLLIGGLVEVGMEFAYRRGEQWIIGAMVLDPPRTRTAQEDVERQHAHGDARLASETEAKAAAARGGTPRSPIHEQKF